tara:strand:- start:58 stop:195 length:138 start_codon:yes stop_codon:yes gene_type:complete
MIREGFKSIADAFARSIVEFGIKLAIIMLLILYIVMAIIDESVNA